MSFQPLDIAAFIGFLAIVVGVSLYASRGKHDATDYFLAGRNLPWWLIGFSLIASNISTEHFVGMAGRGYELGLAIASYEWMAAVTLVLVGLFFLPRFLQAGIYTIPEYLEFRYDLRTRTLMAAFIMAAYVFVALATVLYSGALALESIFGIDTVAGIWLIGILAGGYTIYGGLKAVVWSDLIQGVALLLGGVVVTVLGFQAIGGVERFLEVADGKLHTVLPWNHTEMPWLAVFIGGLWIPNLFYWGLNQFITQRTLAARSLADGQRGLLAASRTNSSIREAIAEGRVATALDDPGDIFRAQLMDMGHEELKGLDVLHFALAFPHVFLGRRNGFDVILGNPPWEKPRVEEDAFWARHFPGLRSRPQRVQETLKVQYRAQRPDLADRLEAEKDGAASMRHLLTAGGFPGMGTGDPDLYKAFVWRFWDLVSPDGGRIGVVLPRSALAAKGSTAFRKELLASAEVLDLTMLVNNREWVFPNVHPQYTIGLTAITRAKDSRESKLRLNGPYANLKRFRAGVRRAPVTFCAREVEAWNDTASLPLLPSDESVEVFAQLRRSPRLDLNDGVGWRARPHRELDATNDKHVMDIESNECPQGFWPVYKGASFDLWTPDTGTYYAWADPERVLGRLRSKRKRANRRSAFAEFDQAWRDDPETLPCLRPRIAFRDVTRATDSRTIRAALVPPRVLLVHNSPFFLLPRGDERDEAFLLGLLSSLPLDWYARRFVETHPTYFVINPFPAPRPDPDNPRRGRVIALAGRLAAQDDRFAEWAGRLGVACGPMDPDEKQDHIWELDAVVAHLYALTESQLVHIFETFHEGWDHEERLRATLHHFRAWQGDQ